MSILCLSVSRVHRWRGIWPQHESYLIHTNLDAIVDAILYLQLILEWVKTLGDVGMG